MSRTTSTNTVTQTAKESIPASPHAPSQRRPSFTDSVWVSPRKPDDAPNTTNRRSLDKRTSPLVHKPLSSSSSSSESDGPHPISRSRVFAARRPRYPSNKAPLKPLSDADGEEDEDSPPFLPFSAAARSSTPPPPAPTDPGATLRISPKYPPKHPQPPHPTPNHRNAPASLNQPSHPSSSSSAQSQPAQSQQSQNTRSQQSTLSTLSPKQRRATKEGSDGTPSMGSSFSDLDDASVTRSALEEALAHDMTNTGMASRMSTISQALKSRYLS